MRGRFVDQGGLFSYIAPKARVPANHPLRKIRELVRDVLGELTRSLGRLYASEGRASIPQEQLLSALLLQVFYRIRSERPLMEQLDYNLLYRWFVGRRSAIDGRTTRHEGYGMSQSCRAMIECIFGWGKQHGTMRKTKHRGLASVATDFMLNLIAYNLIRIPKLLAA